MKIDKMEKKTWTEILIVIIMIINANFTENINPVLWAEFCSGIKLELILIGISIELQLINWCQLLYFYNWLRCLRVKKIFSYVNRVKYEFLIIYLLLYAGELFLSSKFFSRTFMRKYKFNKYFR